MNYYKPYYGFTKTPFQENVAVKNLMKTNQLVATSERIKYTVDLGAIAVITGAIGSGKSSALRYALSQFHPSEYIILYVTATTGSAIEVYKQICDELKVENKSQSKSFLIKQIKSTIIDFWNKRQRPILVIDEACLIRIDIFQELHTIAQFEKDAESKLSIILAGQNNLIDALQYHTSKAFASRVVAKSQLKTLEQAEVESYLNHHLTIAGSKHNLFSPPAVTAIHKLSSGMLRKINNIARGALIASAKSKSQLVEPEHVEIASSEVF
jgi:general secretion pathway protein A